MNPNATVNARLKKIANPKSAPTPIQYQYAYGNWPRERSAATPTVWPGVLDGCMHKLPSISLASVDLAHQEKL